MYVHTLRTRFTFGDCVTFNSPTQGCDGIGRIVAITLEDNNSTHYTLEILESGVFQPGIVDNEILCKQE
jgi:hypothetical protein